MFAVKGRLEVALFAVSVLVVILGMIVVFQVQDAYADACDTAILMCSLYLDIEIAKCDAYGSDSYECYMAREMRIYVCTYLVPLYCGALA